MKKILYTEEQLIDIITKICTYAQSHISNRRYWGKDKVEYIMQAPSIIVACFLAQHTVDGDGGVEWDIIWKPLCGRTKRENTWRKIVKKLVKDFGGASKGES